MTSRIIVVSPFDLVVFGGAGDLAYRKLLPALYHRHRDGQLPTRARIIGVSRRGMSDQDYRNATAEALSEHVAEGERDDADVRTFLERLYFVSVDAQSDRGWNDLKQILEAGSDCCRAFYLAVGPELIGTICGRIGAAGLGTGATRVVIEKPIGHDLASARRVNDSVGAVFDEARLKRVHLVAVAQAGHRGDGASVDGRREGQARIHRLAIDQHGASAAVPLFAAVFDVDVAELA